MDSDASDFSSLFGAIVTAIKCTAGNEASGGELNEQQKQQLVMRKVMQILSGDWSPFDVLRPPIRVFLAVQVAKFDGDVRSYSTHLSSKARDFLGDNGAINEELALNCKEDSDPIGHTSAVLARHMAVIVDLFLSYNDASPFSGALRAAAVEAAGEWLEGLTASFVSGASGVQSFFQKLSLVGGQAVAQRFPQHAMATTFGLPMALGMLTQFHQEYRRNHGASMPPRSDGGSGLNSREPKLD